MQPVEPLLHWKAVHSLLAVKEQALIDCLIAHANGTGPRPTKLMRQEVDRLRVQAKAAKDRALRATTSASDS